MSRNIFATTVNLTNTVTHGTWQKGPQWRGDRITGGKPFNHCTEEYNSGLSKGDRNSEVTSEVSARQGYTVCIVFYVCMVLLSEINSLL